MALAGLAVVCWAASIVCFIIVHHPIPNRALVGWSGDWLYIVGDGLCLIAYVAIVAVTAWAMPREEKIMAAAWAQAAADRAELLAQARQNHPWADLVWLRDDRRRRCGEARRSAGAINLISALPLAGLSVATTLHAPPNWALFLGWLQMILASFSVGLPLAAAFHTYQANRFNREAEFYNDACQLPRATPLSRLSSFLSGLIRRR